MEVCNHSKNLVVSQAKTKIESKTSSEKENVLCNYCKRTSTNGLRCLGMCVADSEY